MPRSKEIDRVRNFVAHHGSSTNLDGGWVDYAFPPVKEDRDRRRDLPYLRERLILYSSKGLCKTGKH